MVLLLLHIKERIYSNPLFQLHTQCNISAFQHFKMNMPDFILGIKTATSKSEMLPDATKHGPVILLHFKIAQYKKI